MPTWQTMMEYGATVDVCSVMALVVYAIVESSVVLRRRRRRGIPSV